MNVMSDGGGECMVQEGRKEGVARLSADGRSTTRGIGN